MRTDKLSHSLLLLAGLLAAAPAMAQAPPDSATPEAAPSSDEPMTGGREIQAGEVVRGDVVVVGGDLRVAGEVTGNAAVAGGDLLLDEGGLIRGDAVVTGGEIIDRGGRILGEMREIGEASAAPAAETAAEGRTTVVVRDSDRRGSWFEPIGEGLAGVVSTLALGLVLAGAGAVLIFYGLPYLEAVSDTVRVSTLRAAAVGLAAGFLALPAFVVLVVALAVSIIGIPLLVIAAPLYPILVVAAFAFGLLAAAHAIGERTTEQRDPVSARFRHAYAYLLGGLALLLAPLIAADLIGMTGFLGWVGTLLKVVAVAILWATATVGFGAVILSRAGTRRTFAARIPDPAFEPDPLFDENPIAGGPRV